MMKINNFIHIFFLIVFAILMNACVPKAIDVKAVCGQNQSFNTITRSCNSIAIINKTAVARNITASFAEDVESEIELDYKDDEDDRATSCQIISVSHIVVKQLCSCDNNGVCTVKVKGDPYYYGSAQFTYAVKTNNVISNKAVATLNITSVNNPPTISAASSGVITALEAKTIDEDAPPLMVNFYIQDPDNYLTCASVVPSVLTNASKISTVAIIGNRDSRTLCTLEIKPAANAYHAFGETSTIRLQLSDGATTATSDFALTIDPILDQPLVPSEYDGILFSQTETFQEDEQSKTINLAFRDVDSFDDVKTIKAKIDTTAACSSTQVSKTHFNDLMVSDNINFALTIPPPADVCDNSVCSVNISVNALNNFTGSACLYYTASDVTGLESNVQAINIIVNPINDTPLLNSLDDTVIMEDLADPSISYTDIYASSGGGIFEANQTLTVTAISANPALIPNVPCQNYTLGSGAPSDVPSATGIYYFDKINFRCYKSSGSISASDWKLYPSLTVFPNCQYLRSGVESPLGRLTPSVAGEYFLNTNENKCYFANGVTSSSWIEVPIYKIAYVPEKDISGTTSITVRVQDNGGNANSAIDYVTRSFSIDVTTVDDSPFFVSSIVRADTNEGGVVVAGPFKIDEDQTNTSGEDNQAISILSVSSDNVSVLPSATNPYATSSIRIFYDLNDNGIEDPDENRSLGVLEDQDTDDAQAHAFYLKLYPVAGVSGNANIKITATDGHTEVTSSFSLVVHPIAALHGGWSNISAVGIKTDKNGAPVSIKTNSNGDLLASSNIKCNYNTSADTYKCDSTNNNCTTTKALDGTVLVAEPHGVVTPSAANILYWDSSNKKCYRSLSTSKFSWVDMTTSCPVTRISVTPTTLTAAAAINASSIAVASTAGFPAAGNITIASTTISYTGKTSTTFTGLSAHPAHTLGSSVSYTANGTNFIIDSNISPTRPVATAKDQYYYDAFNKSCYSSVEGSPGVWGWNSTTYVPSTISLSWNAFTVTGSGADSSVGISGWNVYRREAGHDFDFVSGFLKLNASDTMSITGSSTRTFTDTTAVSGTVYYYLVRPVDNTSRHLTISTPEVFSEVRVFAPKENYAFVHRWMANQEVCNSMLMTTTTSNKVDPTHNYRCPYKGPGESSGYYDIGKDMLVDISEVGCPYTPAPACSSNGCIGIGAPTMTASEKDIYYDRSSGKCYINAGSNDWDVYDLSGFISSASSKTNTALNPPLSYIKQSTAQLVCEARDTSLAAGGTLTLGDHIATLPTKKEFIAYAASPIGMSDSNITELEKGESLNIQSRCNSTNANGLESAYTDSTIPSTSFIYSIPGTSASTIRSIYTGSIPWVNNYGTEACSSRYGIQDVYGNVAEWVQDKMTCYKNKTCSANSGTDLGNYNFYTSSNALTYIYGFDKLTGPYNDTNADGAVGFGDLHLTNWDFRDELYGAGKFSFPLGMPINVDIASAGLGNLANSAALPFLLDIGPTSGITASHLHEDGIIVNGDAVFADPEGPGSQGSFAQGGSYLSGNRSGRYSSELVPDSISGPDLGFRCYIPIVPANYTETDGRHLYSY